MKYVGGFYELLRVAHSGHVLSVVRRVGSATKFAAASVIAIPVDGAVPWIIAGQISHAGHSTAPRIRSARRRATVFLDGCSWHIHRVGRASKQRIATAEFFAGIGLMAAALEPRGFDVAWANDIEPTKRDIYVANREHVAPNFLLDDVCNVHGPDVPDVELATASFPCIDLSLAGNRRGLAGQHSGMLWEFTRVLEEMKDRRPRVVLLENVVGFATSHKGQDLRGALQSLKDLGYSCDVLTINARHFVPQSRQRMFVIGVRGDLPKKAHLGIPPLSDVRPDWIRAIYETHSDLRMHYVELPSLPDGPPSLDEVIERLDADDSRWWDEKRISAFISSLRPVHQKRLGELKSMDIAWRTAYRRTREGKATWEIRADAIAGCLRTTGGGSSKQAIVEARDGAVRLRWMTPLEYSRLMGAGEYNTKVRTDNQALFGFGDAVVVDVIAWIADHYFLPTLRPTSRT
jgi:DNA (cytosine-5)-methyltransferase 1